MCDEQSVPLHKYVLKIPIKAKLELHGKAVTNV